MLKVSVIWILRLVRVVLLSSLIVVAAYVSVGRYYIGYVEDFQQQLVAQLVESSGLSLQVDRLYGRWSKLTPILTVEKLQVFASEAENESVLTIDSLSFKIDPIRTLINRSIQVQNLYINGVKCSLEESEPGQWHLKGYPINYQGGGDANKLIDLLLSVRGAELLNAQVALFFSKDKEASLLVNELSLKHSDGFRRMKLLASFNKSEKSLTAIIESQGDPRKQTSFSARAYVKLDDIDFAPQLPVLNAFDIDLQDAQIDAELWLDWLPNTIITLQGTVVTPKVDIAALSGESLQPLKNLAINFRAEKTSQYHWQAWIPSVSSQWQGQLLQFEQLQLKIDEEQLGLALPKLDLAQVTTQIQSIELLNDKLKDIVKTLNLSGELDNISLTLPRKSAVDEATNRSNQPPRFLLTANLNKVAVSPWHGAPGATGVSGYLELTPSTGKVELDSQLFSMEFPKVYHSPLDFQSALGQLQWQVSDGRVLLESGPLKLTADHGPATGLLNLDLPTKAGAEIPPSMTLTIGLLDTEAAYRNKFIPYILNDDFLKWMKRSVPAGHVNKAGFIYRGSLRKADHDNRTVQLYFDVDNTELNFHEDWPSLSDISGLVEIDDTNVKVTTTKAKMFELAVPSALVEVKRAVGGGMWLTVNADAAGNASDALRVVNESAIKNIVSGAFQTWQLTGDASATVSLGIPLAGASRASEIDVDVQIANADLFIPEYKLDFSEVGGELHYSSERGIFSKDLVGNLYNKPLTVAVKQDSEKIVNVLINGQIDMRDVEGWSQQEALVFAEGSTDFSAQFIIGKKGQGEFTMQSDLQGIDIDLPFPFKKSADQIRPFWLTMPIVNQPLLKMGIDKQAELQLQFKNGTVESGLVIVGKTKNRVHEPQSLILTGSMEKFVFDKWQPVLDRYQQALQNKKSVLVETAEVNEDLAEAEIEAPVTDNAPEFQIKVRQFLLNEFIGFDQQLSDSIVNIDRQGSGWLINASSERLKGEILLPFEELMPIKIALKHLQLPEGFSQQEDDVESIEPFEPLKLDFSVEQLFLSGQPYGSLAFELRSEANSAVFNNIHGNIRGLIIDQDNPATLEWLRTDAGDKSRIYGDFHFDDLGGVLEQWNYQKVISSKNGKASVDLSWDDAPAQWQLEPSVGNIDFQINDGRFLTASDTAASTLKVVGIVNFMNIVRRLKLDFSDLYKSGVSFDNIQGAVNLADSQLNIIDELKVTSPSSGFYLRGDADLMAKELDMELIVTLPVASNLPWIVALAGGIPTAAGVYVASKIFEDQVDKFSSAVYSVSGDWNNPEMKFKRVFDDGKKSKATKDKVQKDSDVQPSADTDVDIPKESVNMSKEPTKNSDKQSEAELP